MRISTLLFCLGLGCLAAPAAAADLVPFGDDVVDIRTGRVVAKIPDIPTGRDVHSVADDTRYFDCTQSGFVRAVRLRDGVQLWRRDVRGPCFKLLKVGGKLARVGYVEVRFLDAATGKLTALHEIGERIAEVAAPAGADFVVARLTGGDMVVVGADGKQRARAKGADTSGGIQEQLVVVGKGVCRLYWKKKGQAQCVDPAGAVSGAIEIKGKELPWRWGGHRRALMATGWWDEPRSALVDPSTGLVNWFSVPVRAMLEKSDGTLVGLLAVDKDGKHMDLLGPWGRRRWRVPAQHLDGVSAAVVGDDVVMGRFHPIATGSLLERRSLKDGKIVWSADVEQLNVGHSKYRNEVRLEIRGDRVLLWGRESAGSYLQVFELATGKRLYSRIDKTW